ARPPLTLPPPPSSTLFPYTTLFRSRGAGGRTPFMTQFDLHLAYGRQFTKMLKLDIYWDIFNLFNQHAAREVDDEYTTDFVMPVRSEEHTSELQSQSKSRMPSSA